MSSVRVAKTDIVLVLLCLLPFAGAWTFWRSTQTAEPGAVSTPSASPMSTAAGPTPGEASPQGRRALVVVGDETVTGEGIPEEPDVAAAAIHALDLKDVQASSTN